MRIEFRLWDYVNKEMWNVENIAWDYGIEHNFLYVDSFKLGNSKTFSRQYELMQSTGLTDINDREIFEGDIVREQYARINNESHYRNKVVKWREFHAGFNIENIGLEVIGNIHGNPELIPEEKTRMLIEGDLNE